MGLIASNAGLADRIDIFEVEQFIALNLYELGKFGADGRRIAVSDFVTRYNEIIDDVETDPSLTNSSSNQKYYAGLRLKSVVDQNRICLLWTRRWAFGETLAVPHEPADILSPCLTLKSALFR